MVFRFFGMEGVVSLLVVVKVMLVIVSLHGSWLPSRLVPPTQAYRRWQTQVQSFEIPDEGSEEEEERSLGSPWRHRPKMLGKVSLVI